jgi:tRNA modification GTPase
LRRARVAEPGEFTFRAFFNKRIDLAQAQAVRDVINAQTQYQARLRPNSSTASCLCHYPLKDALVDIIVHLESSVEFVEMTFHGSRYDAHCRLDDVIDR